MICFGKTLGLISIFFIFLSCEKEVVLNDFSQNENLKIKVKQLTAKNVSLELIADNFQFDNTLDLVEYGYEITIVSDDTTLRNIPFKVGEFSKSINKTDTTTYSFPKQIKKFSDFFVRYYTKKNRLVKYGPYLKISNSILENNLLIMANSLPNNEYYNAILNRAANYNFLIKNENIYRENGFAMSLSNSTIFEIPTLSSLFNNNVIFNSYKFHSFVGDEVILAKDTSYILPPNSLQFYRILFVKYSLNNFQYKRIRMYNDSLALTTAIPDYFNQNTVLFHFNFDNYTVFMTKDQRLRAYDNNNNNYLTVSGTQILNSSGGGINGEYLLDQRNLFCTYKDCGYIVNKDSSKVWVYKKSDLLSSNPNIWTILNKSIDINDGRPMSFVVLRDKLYLLCEKAIYLVNTENNSLDYIKALNHPNFRLLNAGSLVYKENNSFKSLLIGLIDNLPFDSGNLSIAKLELELNE